jgi:hypothetical protein
LIAVITGAAVGGDFGATDSRTGSSGCLIVVITGVAVGGDFGATGPGIGADATVI